jgi:quercetin dioxygenase-like cupin family protein
MTTAADDPQATAGQETEVTDPARGRAGIVLFDPPEGAPSLMETGIMSMPTMDPPAYDQLVEWGGAGGQVVKVLFRQEGEDGREGLSLVWSWFGPGFILPRHSHDADCLYYVVSGEARMGNRRIGAGAGFFVPAGAPYAYTAGPEGIQILEFRNATSFDMRITEGLARWGRIVENARANAEAWKEAEVGA